MGQKGYRSVSARYFELNAIGEVRWSRNLPQCNQRDEHTSDALRRDHSPDAGPGGSPIADLLAQLEGRTFNLDIRAEV